MTNPTSNYSFQMPTSSDLVTDLPADFEVFGQAVDTRLKALQPGTTLGDLAYSSATANTNTRLGIGSTGQVLTVASGVPSWATPAAAGYVGVGVTKSADQSIANGAYTAITWDGEDWDTNTYHDNSTNNSRVTIPSGKAGKYLVTVNLNYASNGAGGIRLVNIYKNGVGTGDTNFQTSSVFNTAAVRSVVMDLAVADYIQAYAYQDCGGALNLKASSLGTSMQVTYLGA